MELQEIQQDLFAMPETYHLAHCISADAKMGAGIAVQFRKRFNLAPLQERAAANELAVGHCYREGRVFNLVTKAKYWQKPTYGTLTAAVKELRDHCVQESIHRIAMPEIGCGLDKLKWGKVREIILQEFQETPVEIVVCRL